MYKISASLRSDFSDCRFARHECRFASQSVAISSEYTLKLAQDLHGSTRKRDDVLFAHLHPLGRDTPFGLFEVDLGPLRLSQFAGPNKNQWCESQRAFRSEKALIRINGAQQFSNPLWLGD
jgi:hypothetical protein